MLPYTMLAEVCGLSLQASSGWGVLVALLLCAGASRAQTAAAPDPNARLKMALERAAAAGAQLRSSLPSFACKEEVVSQELEGRKPKVKRGVAFTAELRVERRADGTLRETFEPASWAEILAQSHGTGIPYYVSGGFQHALDYFDPAMAACYRFSMRPQEPSRIDFIAAPDASTDRCKGEAGLTGFALLDPSGDVIHVERRVPEQVSGSQRLAPFAAIDLAPVTLNGKTYRLSTRVTSDSLRGGARGHFEASYTGCKLFHASITIQSVTDAGGVPPPEPIKP
jgi:hypothetical protein